MSRGFEANQRVLGTTLDFRRDLHIRYADADKAGLPAGVTSLDAYRDP